LQKGHLSEENNMQMNPIGWIEIPVKDIDRAERFYSDYFGFKMARQPEKDAMQMSWFPMDMKSYGAAAMLVQGDTFTPSHEGATLYYTAPGGTVDAGLKKAKEMGIKILFPKTDIGEHGFFAWIEDSEGNRIAIHSMEG